MRARLGSLADVGFHVFGAPEAPTVVLLHGADTTWDRCFRRAIPVLAERYRVIAYGASGFDPTEQSTYRNARAEAERVTRFIRAELGGDLRCLYAHSLGCQTATYVAHDRSVRLGVAILDGAVYANTGSVTGLVARLERPMARVLASDGLARVGRITGLPLLSSRIGESIHTGASVESYRNTAWSNLAWSADLHTLEPRPDVLVHCWWGRRERRAVARGVRLLSRVFPRLRRREFAGLSHGDLCVRLPERLAEEIGLALADAAD